MTIYIGTVSHGTHRTQDLLRRFAEELDRLIVVGTASDTLADAVLAEEAKRHAARLDEPDATDTAHEWAQEHVTKLMDRFNELAPEGVYFGTHEGDGADFGFWPVGD